MNTTAMMKKEDISLKVLGDSLDGFILMCL